jgi:hypothetical protein
MLIHVDIDDRIPKTIRTLLSPAIKEKYLDTVAAAARNEWIRIARRELHSTKNEYIRGIQPVEASPGERTIGLVGWLPNAVENGAESFDQRQSLLGPNSHIRKESKKGGFYANVPFRHATPKSQGLAGPPMGSAYGPRASEHSRRHVYEGNFSAERAKELGQFVYDHAKYLAPTRAGYHHLKKHQSGFLGHTVWGGRLIGKLAPVLRGPNPSHPDPRMRRGHLSDIYKGMVRERHHYAAATQTQYITWRTISSRVMHGWIHPGITARHLAEKVQAYIRRIAPATIKQIFQAALKSGE